MLEFITIVNQIPFEMLEFFLLLIMSTLVMINMSALLAVFYSWVVEPIPEMMSFIDNMYNDTDHTKMHIFILVLFIIFPILSIIYFASYTFLMLSLMMLDVDNKQKFLIDLKTKDK